MRNTGWPRLQSSTTAVLALAVTAGCHGAGASESGAEITARSASAVSPPSLVWTQEQVASGDESTPGDRFGTSVSITRGYAAVTGCQIDVFEASGATWNEVPYPLLSPSFVCPAPATSPAAIAGDVVYWYDLSFQRVNGFWGLQFPSGAGSTSYLFEPPSPDSSFGASVAIDESDSGGYVFVAGGPLAANGAGAVYVFTYSSPSPGGKPQLAASFSGTAGSALGTSVAVSSGVVVAGAPAASSSSGSALVYVEQADGSFALQATLKNDGSAGEAFGAAVAISGSTIVVGAPNVASSAGPGHGGVYIFNRSTSGDWGTGQKWSPADGDSVERFGSSVAVSGPLAVVGAPGASAVNPSQGAAYALTLSPGTVSALPLSPSAGAANDAFGTSVALSGRTAIVGAPRDANGQTTVSGLVYVFAGLVPAGGSCAVDGDCVEGHCVDGTCCSTVCPGPCRSCATGVCTPIADASDPNGCTDPFTCNESAQCTCATSVLGGVCCSGPCAGPCHTCAPSGTCAAIAGQDDPDGGCSGNQTCSAAATCGLKTGQAAASATSCASGFLVDGVCCNSPCDGACDVCTSARGAATDGVCSPAPAGFAGDPACGAGRLCDGVHVSCPSAACASDSACAAGYYCSAAGTCAPAKALGSMCSEAAGNDCMAAGCGVCGPAHCTDGVCCGAVACPRCEACAANLQAPNVQSGVCLPALAGSDPHDDCPSDPAGCGPDGACDGLGKCRMFALPNHPCGTTTCTGGFVTGALCNGAGACKFDENATCAPYLCAAGSCTYACNGDLDCAAGAYCKGGTCQPMQALGATCTANDACQPLGMATGQCVDGVCCDSPCAGTCQACDVPGHVGTCVPIPAGMAAHGARVKCTSDQSSCSGTCNGVSPSCVYPAAGLPCGSVCADALLTANSCSGEGRCAGSAPTQCPGNFACAPDKMGCNVGCASIADCKSGSACSPEHACVPMAASRCTGLQEAVNVSAGGDAGVSECAPYVCDADSGTCKSGCTTVLDCAPPNVCNPQGSCIAPPASSGNGGCSIVPGVRPPEGGLSWALLVVAFGLVAAARSRLRCSHHE